MQAALDRDGLEAMKVPELRAALATQGLDSTGIKRELVDRLMGLDNGATEPTAAPESEVVAPPPTEEAKAEEEHPASSPAPDAAPPLAYAPEGAAPPEAPELSEAEPAGALEPGPSSAVEAALALAPYGNGTTYAPVLPAVVPPPSTLETLRADVHGLRRQHQELTSLVGQWYQSVMGLQQQAAAAAAAAARVATAPMGYPGYASYPPQAYGVAPGYPPGYPHVAPQPQTNTWQELSTAEGHMYYYNAQTGQTSWERPHDYHHDYHPAKRQAVGGGGGGGGLNNPKSKGPPGANLFVVRTMTSDDL
jgi:hypothetical protein